MSTTSTMTARGPGRPVDPVRQEARRRAILEAAGRVFAEYGYANTDVAQVAALLGLTKAAVYHYFKSKEQLFFETVDAKLGKLSEEMAALAGQFADSLDGIEAACTLYLRFFQDNPDAVELMVQERSSFKNRAAPTYFRYRDATLSQWTATLERLAALGKLRAVAPVATLRLISDLLYGRVITNFFVGDMRPVEEQSREIVDLLLQGLLARDGAVEQRRA